MEDSDLVVNWKGERSRGWGGWAEKGGQVEETFRFVCPNNPAARDKTLRRLRELLGRYAFKGVFLDKIRFPSPANGIDEALSCFCDHCRREARAVGLDLDAVAKMLADRAIGLDVSTAAGSRGDLGLGWTRSFLPIPFFRVSSAFGQIRSQVSSHASLTKPGLWDASFPLTFSRPPLRRLWGKTIGVCRSTARGQSR